MSVFKEGNVSQVVVFGKAPQVGQLPRMPSVGQTVSCFGQTVSCFGLTVSCFGLTVQKHVNASWMKSLNASTLDWSWPI